MNDSVRIRTDTTLDSGLWTESKRARTYSMMVSLLTTCLNLNTPPLAQVAPFRCAGIPLDTKLSKHICQLILVCTTQTFPSLVYCILTIPECQSDHHGSCTRTAWFLGKCLFSLSSSRFSGLLIVLRQFSTWRQSVHKISYCLLLLLCSCFCSLLLLCSLLS